MGAVVPVVMIGSGVGAATATAGLGAGAVAGAGAGTVTGAGVGAATGTAAGAGAGAFTGAATGIVGFWMYTGLYQSFSGKKVAPGSSQRSSQGGRLRGGVGWGGGGGRVQVL